MKVFAKCALGLGLALAAAPAWAGEQDCLQLGDATLGASLVDQFLFEEGLAERPDPYLDSLQSAMDGCIDAHSVSDDDALLFTELNIGYVMKVEVAKRLTEAGVDVASLDRIMAPNIPTVSTTFDQMFDELGPEFEQQVERMIETSGLDATYAESLIGGYTGAFHSSYVSKMAWDARK